MVDQGMWALMAKRTVAQEKASILTETGRLYEGSEELEELLDALVRAARREAAAEIRAEADTWEGWPEKQATMRKDADLIEAIEAVDDAA
jgi:hypothetical protein